MVVKIVKMMKLYSEVHLKEMQPIVLTYYGTLMKMLYIGSLTK